MDLNAYDRNDYILTGTEDVSVPLLDLSDDTIDSYRFIGGRDTDKK